MGLKVACMLRLIHGATKAAKVEVELGKRGEQLLRNW